MTRCPECERDTVGVSVLIAHLVMNHGIEYADARHRATEAFDDG